MKPIHASLRRAGAMSLATIILAGPMWGTATAVEVQDLKGFEPLFGRYAPAGDCGRQPQIVVDVDGFAFEVGGASERGDRPEFAASYGGNFYQGISQWFFPYRNAAGFPILLTFNHGETPGVLAVEGHDAGWPGGPPLSARDQVLVDGSPYAKCR